MIPDSAGIMLNLTGRDGPRTLASDGVLTTKVGAKACTLLGVKAGVYIVGTTVVVTVEGISGSIGVKL